MGNGAGDDHEIQYVHLCSTLFVDVDGVTDLLFVIFFNSPAAVFWVLFCTISCHSPFVSVVVYVPWWVVFSGGFAFNADISKWETGKVSWMDWSTSTCIFHFLFIGWCRL